MTDNQKRLLEALAACAGDVTEATRKAGVHRQTHYEALKSSPEYKEAFHHIEESLIDLAETKLKQHINEGNLKAITFYLRSKGKERGYGESKQIEITGERKKLSWFTDEDAKDVL